MNQLTESFEDLSLILSTLLRKSGVAVDAELETALKEILQNLESSEEVGGVCAEWPNDDEHNAKLAALIQAGLAADCALLNLAASAADQNPVTLFVIDRAGGDFIRLYSNRKFFEENRLANQIARLIQYPDSRRSEIVKALEGLQKKAQAEKKNNAHALVLNPLQKQAAQLAAASSFCVICGGPGTGKTTSVTNFLEAAMAVRPDVVVTLCAPTGKAKSRLYESVQSTADGSDLYPNVKKALEAGRISSFTIHKLLTEPTSNGSRPNAQNPLECQILIIDEASMIDAELAQKLFIAINPETTKTLVLGDKHQLAAVGPGSVFADISDQTSPLAPYICELLESIRFSDKSKVGIVAQRILGLTEKNCDVNPFIELIKENAGKMQEGFPEVGFYPEPPDRATRLSEPAKLWLKQKMGLYGSAVEGLLKTIHRSERPQRAQALEFEALDPKVQKELLGVWDILSSFRPLCAQRRGPMSLQAVNNFCEDLLRERLNTAVNDDFFIGKVIIVRKNDPSGISNGDVAILFPVYFEGESKAEWYAYIGDLKKIFPAQLLPNYDTAFAITVHQSQGSGFDNVAVFLPSLDSSAEGSKARSLCTRELLYTGFTRTKKTCQIFGSKEALAISLATVTKRSSGLQDRLKEKMGVLF